MDRTWRINIFLLLCVLISAVASLIYKTPSIALVDIATSCTFALLGIVVGKHIRSVKLANISQNRQLIIQRDTDALTRLLNRRRLFEVLEEHTGEAVNSFTGIMMIDIDEFKVYNDFYGHQKGDECLRKLGECFAEFGRKHELTFFRYGGEEFTALSRSYSYQGLEEAARKLREAVHALHIPTEVSSHAIVTISIGFAEAEACQCYQYEKLLCMSDQALFYVKSNGRDRAMGYLEYRHVSDSIK